MAMNMILFANSLIIFLIIVLNWILTIAGTTVFCQALEIGLEMYMIFIFAFTIN